eukprot:CAMPEP_0114690582 /NCGR_PEP_ID=MMETSP0191-20121206/65880_1 /TAXON_ID=126664 /ORGANISM="Sorites sp." /LENGTH=206 /DNA_ID=CAMNT_0001980725 /DNA_START=11 /DNA_END=628 /DNA_ORIENTATION=-
MPTPQVPCGVRRRLHGKHPPGDLWVSHSSRDAKPVMGSKPPDFVPAVLQLQQRSQARILKEEAQEPEPSKQQSDEEEEEEDDVSQKPLEPGEKRPKCRREVQVMFHCKDREKGFNRSITAKCIKDRKILKSKMTQLQARAKVQLTYDEVVQALKELRREFANPPGANYDDRLGNRDLPDHQDEKIQRILWSNSGGLVSADRRDSSC